MESNLLKLSFICSLLGILLLMFISERIEVKESYISSITMSKIDNDVKITANVLSVNRLQDVMFLKVKDATASMDVVAFEPEDSFILAPGDNIEIQGKVALYNNKLEIIAKTIKSV